METMAVKTTLSFKMGSPMIMELTAHNHTAFIGTLCFGCIFLHIGENGIPPSLDRA
jgi:hypothetical protein